MTTPRSSREGTAAKAFRLDPAEHKSALAALPKGWTMTAFIRACQRALAADPEEFITRLTPHRPQDRPVGRPPKPRS